MRTIMFRGKSLLTAEWLYGSLIADSEIGVGIFHKGIIQAVDAETVGQYTGVTDKNDIGVYEGDIIFNDWENCNGKQLGENHIVKFGHHMASSDRYASEVYGWYAAPIANPDDEKSLTTGSAWEIVGNIHDNPELLEIEKDPTAVTVES